MSVHLFGVRHHGVGLARALIHALDALQPDAILLEGPPDGETVLPLVNDPAMQPPVALLIYNPDQPAQAVWYPFAQFSPEWVAIRYALERGLPVAFMDLPQKHMLAMSRQAPSEDEPIPDETPEDAVPTAIDVNTPDGNTPSPNGHVETPEPEAPPGLRIRLDPLGSLARAAGYEDGERWWDAMIEQGMHGDALATFEAVADAMMTLREEAERGMPPDMFPFEHFREAWMRKTIRTAEKQYEKIAVICGAWHVPALTDERRHGKGSAKADTDRLKGLPSVKTAATFAPWTYDRLAMNSGYGAGIASPGWYDHLWTTPSHQVSARWLARVAALLRAEDLNASTAQVIDGVRLAEALAALRNRSVPTLDEMNEAARAVFCRGEDAPMRLIERRLIVGEHMGSVPDETPTVPLQRDLETHQKELKFKPVLELKDYDFDLRKPTDLARSVLLHRLALLGVHWGVPTGASGRAQGTFHEFWRVQWQPEMMIQIIIASRWGNTVRAAAAACASDAAANADNLPELVEMLSHVLLADLPDAADAVVRRLADVAALTTDVGLLMDALPRLIQVARYGDVRAAGDSERIEAVRGVVDGLVARICVGLLPACYALDDDAANAMFVRFVNVDGAIRLLENAVYSAEWTAALRTIADTESINGIVAGRAVRLLRDHGTFPPQEVTRRIGLALSTAVAPSEAAAWIEGFLRGSGSLLLHDDSLFVALDTWIASLESPAFEPILPLLRRTFATFHPPERRSIGERAKRGKHTLIEQEPLDEARANLVLPALARLLGVES